MPFGVPAAEILSAFGFAYGYRARELLANYEEVFGSDEPAAALGCGSGVVKAD